MGYQGIRMGGKIYSLRVAKGMTQEQLAAELCISPAAVSKWERNLANPNIEMLVALADLFECTIDELAGRNVQRLERMGVYDDTKLRLVELAEVLLRCCEVCRSEGFLALDGEMAEYNGGSEFLPFAISFFLDNILKGMDRALIFKLLENYVRTLQDEEQPEGYMITEALDMITAGKAPEMLREFMASHIGISYRKRMDAMDRQEKHKRTREEILAGYKDKEPFSKKTVLLECFEQIEDFEIRAILRNVDNETLTAALCGASGRVITRFLSNLSDRLLFYVSEDIDRWNGTEEEIGIAQGKILKLI